MAAILKNIQLFAIFEAIPRNCALTKLKTLRIVPTAGVSGVKNLGPKTGAIRYDARKGLPDKGSAIKGCLSMKFISIFWVKDATK